MMGDKRYQCLKKGGREFGEIGLPLQHGDPTTCFAGVSSPGARQQEGSDGL